MGDKSTRWNEMLVRKDRKKCKHGKDTFCCRCEYGESHNQEEHCACAYELQKRVQELERQVEEAKEFGTRAVDELGKEICHSGNVQAGYMVQEWTVNELRAALSLAHEALRVVENEVMRRDECVFCSTTNFEKHEDTCEIHLIEQSLSHDSIKREAERIAKLEAGHTYAINRAFELSERVEKLESTARKLGEALKVVESKSQYHHRDWQEWVDAREALSEARERGVI